MKRDIDSAFSLLLTANLTWSDRKETLKSIRRILGRHKKWKRFSGAYMITQQESLGETGCVLYVGETLALPQRIAQHLNGPASGDNKHQHLKDLFSGGGSLGLVLFAITPDVLVVDQDPDDDEPIIESGSEKVFAQDLESILLQAHEQMFGQLPPWNTRNDVSDVRSDFNLLRYNTLLKWLFSDEGSMDFVWKSIKNEESAARNEIERRIPSGLPDISTKPAKA